MDWSNFDKSHRTLKNVLRDLTENNKKQHELDIYRDCVTYGREIKIIVERIEEETQTYTKLSRKILEMTPRGKEPNEKLLDIFVYCHSSIRLDIKSFFIFTRIFIDTLAKIVRLRFDGERKQLPPTMTKLLKDDKLLALDPDFARGLKSKMSWMTAFVETRVEIEHYLGNILRYTSTGDGKFGFTIKGSRSHGNIPLLATEKVESITEYMEDILSKLSKAILHICGDFPARARKLRKHLNDASCRMSVNLTTNYGSGIVEWN